MESQRAPSQPKTNEEIATQTWLRSYLEADTTLMSYLQGGVWLHSVPKSVALPVVKIDRQDSADLYTVGVACSILKLFKLPDGNQSIIVHGLTRFRLMSIEQTEPFLLGRVEVLEDVLNPSPEFDALLGSVRQQANRVIELSP